MLDFVRSYIEERAQIRREVDALLAEYGADSFLKAKDRAFDVMNRTGWDSTETERAWNIVRGVELRLKIHHQPDTATRYLERLPR